MTTCAIACPREGTPQDLKSAGIIDNDEVILRASYDPMHWRTGRVANSFVRAEDLFKGELSVWRSSMKSGLSLADVFSIAKRLGPNGQVVKQLHGPTAQQIRDIVCDQGHRLFCVVDETETDGLGGFHHAHAHIRICDGKRASMADTKDVMFQAARERLIFFMKQPDSTYQPNGRPVSNEAATANPV